MFLAITRASIVIFSQYLAEILLRKKEIKRCYIFLPHLVNASTLPCETENTKIVSFHENVSCWFASRHISHIGIITWSLLDYLFIHKTIGCMHHQDQEREQGIQLPVSHTLIDHHICHGVRLLGCHLKNGSFSSSSMNGMLWIALLRCSTISTKC